MVYVVYVARCGHRKNNNATPTETFYGADLRARRGLFWLVSVQRLFRFFGNQVHHWSPHQSVTQFRNKSARNCSIIAEKIMPTYAKQSIAWIFCGHGLRPCASYGHIRSWEWIAWSTQIKFVSPSLCQPAGDALNINSKKIRSDRFRADQTWPHHVMQHLGPRRSSSRAPAPGQRCSR
jgi:hypothetical protein